MKQRRFNVRHKELRDQFNKMEIPCHKDLLDLSHEQINFDAERRERLEQLYQRQKSVREEATEELKHRRQRFREIAREELQEIVQKKRENEGKPRINLVTPIASSVVKDDQERQPAFKSPPHPKMKSEGVPKAIQKAPPPKLEDVEETELPPPPEVPHPSEITKES